MPSPNQYRIAVAARKRGVGKTTIACGLASVFAAQQKSVLVIDIDPQSNAAYALGVDPTAPGTAELLMSKHSTPLIANEYLHVYPGGPNLNNQALQSLYPEDLADIIDRLPYEVIILDRVTDTRELKLQHVEDLMMSMAVLGLLEPLAIDIRGRLLAGGHRKAAIYLLKERMPTEYAARFPNESIPVFTLPFDADLEPDLALQVEIAENEKRRDYTRAEVKVLAERLKSAGYSDTQDRPMKGNKPLRPALKVIIGKSIKTVQRYLNDAIETSTSNVRLFSDADALSSLRRVSSIGTKNCVEEIYSIK